MRGVQVVYEDEDGLSWAQQRSGGRIMIITHIPHYSGHQEVLRSNGQNCRLFWATLKVWVLPSESQRRKKLDSKEALLPGNFASPESFCTYNRKTCLSVTILWGLSGQIEIRPDSLKKITASFKTVEIFPVETLRMISHFPDGCKTAWIFPDGCKFSGQFQNCPDFPDGFPFPRRFQNCPDSLRTLIMHYLAMP